MSVNRVLDNYQITAKIDELEDQIAELKRHDSFDKTQKLERDFLELKEEIENLKKEKLKE